MKKIEHRGDRAFLFSYEMSVRTSTCLESLEIYTIEQLIMWSEAELLNTKNIGRKSLTEIKEILASLNLKLREEN